MTCKCTDCDCGDNCKCCECCSGGKCTCPPGKCKCCSSSSKKSGGSCCSSGASGDMKARVKDNLPAIAMILGAGLLVGFALGKSSASK
mmetsp:Transcript_14955/g.29090  ORF Transcript_14955/g.29090 Transcript_14955/m.29090 type:complete len:88 (+) Transcript_14955:97-360(+)|eukprot:CAMPEP_0171495606 /NCGR_PEP_ID=MMETSP0958-20121227/6235_1 /TAXON_ID=87120 /ORGANISM="Aurantiochytrium limacinum, Strain ATCCMYA-1381" /LENGTH=87 /DNA_ID=CAMNT_0012029607 /DNA_START=171 /DNA_END=434 /DNA_ORIENTATION=+